MSSKDEKRTDDGILARVVHLTKLATCAYLSILFIGMAIILGGSIALRYFFDYPISWSNVITRYAYIHIVLLGAAVSYIEGGHAQIETFYERSSRKTRIVFDFIHYGVMTILCLVLTVMGTKQAAAMWDVHPPILAGFPLGAVYLAVPGCAVIMMLHILRLILTRKNRKEP